MCQHLLITPQRVVIPHLNMFRQEAMLPVDWVFPTPSVEKRTMYQWMGDMLEERKAEHEHERCARRKSKAEHPDVQTFNPEHPSWLSSMVY